MLTIRHSCNRGHAASYTTIVNTTDDEFAEDPDEEQAAHAGEEAETGEGAAASSQTSTTASSAKEKKERAKVQKAALKDNEMRTGKEFEAYAALRAELLPAEPTSVQLAAHADALTVVFFRPSHINLKKCYTAVICN